MNRLDRILCGLGIHAWGYYAVNGYEERECKRCGKVDWFSAMNGRWFPVLPARKGE